MVEKVHSRRSPGRPREFDPDLALDRAVETFWRLGYEGADTVTLAEAMGVTKPSIYGTFGSKEQLFLKALQRYADTVGVAQLQALLTPSDIRTGVEAFFEKAAISFSGEHGPRGCFHISVASESAEKMPQVRSFLAGAVDAADQAIAARFEKAVAESQIGATIDSTQRARILTDLARGLALRGRAGTPRKRMLELAAEHAHIVLGP